VCSEYKKEEKFFFQNPHVCHVLESFVSVYENILLIEVIEDMK